MNGTAYALGTLNTPMTLVAATAIGVLFGFFLEQAGFGSSRRLSGIFYFRDMSVLKVMFTAVVVALVGMHYLFAIGAVDLDQIFLLETFWVAQALGGFLFGVGFVVGGWCPGTAFVGLASGKWDALVFLVGAAIGSVAFNEVFHLIEPIYSGFRAGAVTLTDAVPLDTPWVVLAVCLIAIAAFAVSTAIECRVGERRPPSRAARLRHAGAAILLVLCGAGLLLLPEQDATEMRASIRSASRAERHPTPEQLMAEVAAGDDHLEPAELAQMILDGDRNPFLVDIRPQDAYEAFHLRGAVNVRLTEVLARASAEFPRDRPVVLYSNGTVHAAQAWLELRRLGWTNIRILTDGLVGFWRDCLTPPALQGIPLVGPHREAAYGRYLRCRRYFLETSVVERPAAQPEESQLTPQPLIALGVETHLVSTDWLARNLGEKGIVVIDVRAKSSDYTAGHIPTARYLGMESLRSTIDGTPVMMLPAQELALRFGAIGLKPSDTAIVYGDSLRDGTFAALALARLGHSSFAVLHGAFPKWLAEKRPVTRAIHPIESTAYPPVPGADTFTIDIDAVNRARHDAETLIIDVRPKDYFVGLKSDEARPGHIPGAVNREYTLDLARETERWQDLDSLREAYSQLGLKDTSRVIVHCRTGHQASQTFFLLHFLLGVENVRWFDGSWSQWAARPELPAER